MPCNQPERLLAEPMAVVVAWGRPWELGRVRSSEVRLSWRAMPSSYACMLVWSQPEHHTCGPELRTPALPKNIMLGFVSSGWNQGTASF
jgi:hypothetical protein